MPPESSQHPPSANRSLSRRAFVMMTGVAVSAATVGCNGLRSSESPEGEGDTIEVIVENQTTETAQIAVQIEDSVGTSLFSRVYEMEPNHRDESAGIDEQPATVTVFSRGGESAVWDYTPPADLDCEGKDIVFALTQEQGFAEWYSC